MEIFLIVFILSNFNSGLRAAEMTLENSQGTENVLLTPQTFAKFNSPENLTATVDLATKISTDANNHTEGTSNSTQPIPIGGITTLETLNVEAPATKVNSTTIIYENAINDTKETPNFTLSTAETQKTTLRSVNATACLAKSILQRATLSGINFTADQTLKKNHTLLQNTTVSKKKQKKNKTRSILRPTTIKKNKSTRAPFNYTRLDWTGVRTEPTTREIDYKESSEIIHESYKKFMLRTRVFVDKSLLIQEFIEHPQQVICITRPRFWGKSLNLNMIRKFFEIEVDPQGVAKPEEDRINRKIFCGGQISVNASATKTLDALKIASVPSAMKLQGQHPVIQMNFGFLRNGAYDEIISGMKYEVLRSFKKHFYLESYFEENWSISSSAQRSTLERYSAGNITTDDLSRSLRFLSELLYRYFNRMVFILIDDYDVPIVEAFRMEPDSTQNLHRVLEFYRLFYAYGFKYNLHLAKGFLTGQLRIAGSNLFENLTNIAEYTLLDPQFTQFYGFTEREVDEVLANASKTDAYNIKLFYKGFNYGDQIMYNPWCIKQCVENDCKKEYYWLRSGMLFPGNKIKYSLEGLRQDIKIVLSGQSIVIPIDNEVTFYDLQETKNFFNFILFAGYLNPVEKYPNGTYQLMKPNGEANLFYGTMLGEWLMQHGRKFGWFGITWPTPSNFTTIASASTLLVSSSSFKFEANETTTSSMSSSVFEAILTTALIT